MQQLTYISCFFFNFFSFFCCWFVLVSCFLFFSSSFLPARCIVFFFSFCSFHAGPFLLLLMVCSCFYFFLLLSIPGFFLVPLRWCRVVMLKTVVYGNQVRFESLKNSAGTSTKSELCYIVTYVDSHLHTCTYICRIIHNDTTTKTDTWRITQEDFFNNIFTSDFIARVQKGCSRFACERVLETEHKLHILTPLLWPSRCVFLVLLLFNRRPRAHSIGGFREPPRSGVAFPTTSGL